MTDNEKIQQWKVGVVCKNVPDYLNDDAAAMSLLDTLVEKGYYVKLMYSAATTPECWVAQILRPSGGVFGATTERGNNRRAAVVAAVLLLLESNQ